MISKVNCQLYIEGVQIPFNSLSIQATVNQPSICTIEVAPSEFVRKLLPRSHILVTFLEDKTWRILWDGEMRGWGMAKSSSGVSMQITAMDMSNGFGFMTRNIIDHLDAQTSIQAVFHTGQEFQFSASGGGTFADQINKSFGENSDKNVTNIIYTIVKDVYDSIPYFSYYNIKNKILERLVSIEDTEIEKLMKNSVAVDYMNGIVTNRFTGNISLDQIINYFLDIVGYCRVPIVAPSRYNGLSPVTLFKPYAHFSTPPVCNCFFPDMYHTISGLGVDYLTEPTRIILSSQETSPTKTDPGFTSLWFFNEKGSVSPSSNTNEELMNSFLSDDEINKGILPFEKKLNYEQVLNVKRDDGDFDSMKRSMQGMAYWEYVKAKFAHRTAQLGCTFHPFVVVGFPGVIFDPHQSLFGMIESVSHVISADGTAATNVGFSHVYPADRSEKVILYRPPTPKWVSDKYKPRGCDATYKELFGSNSTGHAALGGDKVNSVKNNSINPGNDSKFIYNDDQINIADIAASVFYIPKELSSTIKKEDTPIYSGANANANFAYEYTRREVISLFDYMKSMNMGSSWDNSIEPPSLLSGTADIYLHPSEFEYKKGKYEALSKLVARRQDIAKLLQADLNNVTGKLGK